MMQKFPWPLINAHTHAAMVGFRGLAEDLPLDKWLKDYIWPTEKEKLNPEFVYQESKKAIIEMKKNGIGAISDMYFFEEELARAAKDTGMYALIGEGITDFPNPSAKNPAETLTKTERLLIKYKNDPLIKVAVAPHSIYSVSQNILRQAKDLSRKYGAIFHIHLAETKQEFDDCQKKHGKTPVKYLDDLGILNGKTLLAHCVWVTDKDIEIMAKRKVSVAHCPLSNLKLGSGIAPIAKMIDKGVNVALGTDGAASSNRLDIWEAGKFAALLQKGINYNPTKLPAKTVIKMMTANGMKALGFSEINGKKIKDIEKEINAQNNFNFLYELNCEEMNF